MAKLIILTVSELPKPNVRVCYWIDVPAGQEAYYAAERTINEAGETKTQFVDATVPEITAITAGDIVEIVETHEFEIGTSLNDIKATIVERGLDLVNEIANSDRFAYYGTYYDGSWN